MPFNGSGTYNPPTPEFPAVANTTILASDFNAIINDIAAALAKALITDGQNQMLANLTMNSFKVVGAGEATADDDLPTLDQVNGLIATAVAVAATTTSAGTVELATSAETITGTDATRAVTPAGLAALTTSETRAGLVELATTAETQALTDTARAVVPASLAAITPRAWVTFNGVGSTTILASYNVTSVTRNATGDYTINFTNALPNANYAIIGMSESGTGGANVTVKANTVGGTLTLKSTTQCRVVAGNGSSLVDVSHMSIIVFGN